LSFEGKRDYITVIGGANVDIKGRSFDVLKMGTSNPGAINISPGGVGRNIAHNLSLLNIPVILLTCIGKDLFGRMVYEETEKAKVNMEHVKVSKERTGVYLAILNEKGEMEVALSDMRILEEVDLSYIEEKMDVIKGSKIVVLDTNLNTNIIELVVNLCNDRNIPVVVDPVSYEKAKKIKGLVHKIDYLIPNKRELFSIVNNEREDIITAVHELKSMGAKEVIVKLGEKGIFVSSENEFIPPIPYNVVDVTGAGDSFTAGFTYGVYHGYAIREAVMFGLAVSALTISTPYSVYPELSEEKIKKFLGEVFER